ncbi:MAG TPA: hypothetical protein PK765_04335 [bacterium]|nr:hypothetical protein [bacterium]
MRFLVPSVESATAYGCLITGPKPATGSGSEGISVVVRRANIVELTFT